MGKYVFGEILLFAKRNYSVIPVNQVVLLKCGWLKSDVAAVVFSNKKVE